MSRQAEFLLLKIKCAELGIFDNKDLFFAAQSLLDNGNYPIHI